MDKLINVPEDVVLDSFLLQYEDVKKEFAINPIPMQAGDAYQLRIRVSDERIVDKNEEEEIIQPTEIELFFKIFQSNQRIKKKWRYLNVDGIVPTYTQKIS